MVHSALLPLLRPIITADAPPLHRRAPPLLRQLSRLSAIGYYQPEDEYYKSHVTRHTSHVTRNAQLNPTAARPAPG
jgi:hypothetical protein